MSDYSVFGGEGSLGVVTEDLRAESARYRAALGHLAGCSGTMFYPGGAPYGLPVTHPHLVQAFEQVKTKAYSASLALDAVKEKMSALATQLSSCASTYQAAEERAKAQPGGFKSHLLYPKGVLGAMSVLALPDDFPVGALWLFSPAAAAAAVATQSQLGSIGSMAIAALAKGANEGAPPGMEVSAAAVKALTERINAGALGVPGRHGLGALGGLTGTVADVSPLGPIATEPPQLMGDAPAADGLAGMVGLQGRAWDGKGQLLYTRVTDAQGQETWIVTIPGTQDAEGGAWGSRRIAEAMSGKTENVSAAVLNGLASVGAKPGARIVLSGHSQGGRHAINLSSDKVLSTRYKVAGVVTAGAPSGTQETPRGVKVIQLEDPDDPVPGLDGAAGVPTNRERVLVRSATGGSIHADPGGKAGILGWEHKVANYQELAAKADADKGEALTKAISALGIKGGQSTTYQVPTSAGPPPPPREPIPAPTGEGKVFYGGR
ncbi:alpha/beta hydrolase family protein [Galactobacter caseinivorans]|uniref:Alpha/beta hydrolase n=1 Tax=Galactobacter caseinivorans TaxID=2676123 RepID=A0A496PHY8_9MICC|nr:hypothetical protein [Galactobacter caseinivorans]RKW70106.1 hypothetical protein DWQ67_09105 [Galactobacter caseinivorans]